MNTLPAKLLRSAQQCQSKNGIRYYLNGICISSLGYIYGTNGHFAFIAPIPEGDLWDKLEKDYIIQLESVITTTADLCDYALLTDTEGCLVGRSVGG